MKNAGCASNSRITRAMSNVCGDSSPGFTDLKQEAICNLLEVGGSVLVVTNNAEAMKNNIVELTEANFETEVLQSGPPGSRGFLRSVVWSVQNDCTAAGAVCGRIRGPIEVRQGERGRDIRLAASFEITGVPTLMLFRGGEPWISSWAFPAHAS